jgi:predicted anti-sigma-YlaC factor YlaD
MRHQPFEAWITEEKPLSSDQAQSLQEHMQTCDECRQFYHSWAATQELLAARSMIQPAPGFARRWRSSTAERRMIQQQLQVRRTLLYLMMGTVLSFVVFLGFIGLTVSPSNLFLIGIRSISQLLLEYHHAQQTIYPVLQSLPPFIPVALWILFTTSLAIFSLIWVGTLWRISTQGVTNK